MDRHPTSDSPVARPHGRVDAFVAVLRAVLAICASVYDAMPTSVFVALVVVASIAQLYAFLNFLPYYAVDMNQLHVSLSAVIVWASFCMALAQLRDKPTVRTALLCWWDIVCPTTSCAVLCCAVLCCAVLCCAVLCCAVLCCAVLCCRTSLLVAVGVVLPTV